MRSDPKLFVTCDHCESAEVEIQFRLTAQARGGFEEVPLADAIARAGWFTHKGKDYCPTCAGRVKA